MPDSGDHHNPAIGVVMMAFVGLRIKPRVKTRKQVIPIIIGVIAVAGLVLTVLLGIEAATWAAAYLWLGTFHSSFDAMLFSVGSIFGVMQVYWPMLSSRSGATPRKELPRASRQRNSRNS
jgi:hypothetical protein